MKLSRFLSAYALAVSLIWAPVAEAGLINQYINPSYPAGVVGNATGNAVTAGSLGEVISSSVAGTAVSLTNSTPVNLTSISLTAGDWDVVGTVVYVPAGTTTTTVSSGAVSLTTGSLGTSTNNTAFVQLAFPGAAGVVQAFPVGKTRIFITTTTTIYLVGQLTFLVSTATGGGTITARRVG